MRRLAIFLLACLFSSFGYAGTQPDIGVISYWGTNAAQYDQLPEGATALVNPDNGIFVSSGQTKILVPDLTQYKAIVKKAADRDVAMLGYVPTGYFNHTCDVRRNALESSGSGQSERLHDADTDRFAGTAKSKRVATAGRYSAFRAHDLDGLCHRRQTGSPQRSQPSVHDAEAGLIGPTHADARGSQPAIIIGNQLRQIGAKASSDGAGSHLMKRVNVGVAASNASSTASDAKGIRSKRCEVKATELRFMANSIGLGAMDDCVT